MEERIKQLEKELFELKEYFRTHQHKGYDHSEKLSSGIGSPSGANGSIQFNQGGIFGGNSRFVYDYTADTVTLGDIGSFADFSLYGGNGSGSTTGVNIAFQAGNGGTTGTGADASIVGGSGGSTSGAGGNANVSGGTGKDANGGNVYLTPGGVSGTGDDGNVVIGKNTSSNTRNGAFLYIPVVAGTPSGTPASITNRVVLVYDTTNNKLWVYDGGWISVALA